jgi:large subunit ribosomal protein L4
MSPATDSEPNEAAEADSAANASTPDEKPAKASPAKRTAKASTAKASTTRASTTKASAAKASAAKDSAAKDSAAKDSAAKSGPAKSSTAKAGAAKSGTARTGAKAGPAKASTAKTSTASGASVTEEKPELPASIFDAKVNVPLIHQVVVAQEAAARQGTHATKTRGAVRGGGRKPYRQKGTGRARQGSNRAPQFAGGGVVHGPHPRSYAQRTPKKMKAAALRGALSDRARHGRIHVVSGLVDGDAPRTRDAVAALTALLGSAPVASPVLVVVSASDTVTWKSLRNARGVHLLDSGQLNTRDVLVSEHVVFTRDAYDAFVARANPGVGAKQEG